MKKRIVFLESEIYLSASQANTYIKKLWQDLAARDSTIKITSIDISKSARQVIPHMQTLQNADKIIFTTLSKVALNVFSFLRASLELTTPMVFHLHGNASSGPAFFHPYEPHLLAHDEFLVSSSAEKKTVQCSFIQPRIIKIPFLPFLAPVDDSSKAWSECSRFVYIGRISDQKNLHALIRAFGRLKRLYQHNNFELLIYGAQDRLGAPNFGIPSRGYKSFLQKIIRDEGIKGIRWMGFRAQEWLDQNVLKNPHVFVSPSFHIGENFGLAAFRSLSLGNPTVLSAWGGHLDFKSIFNKQVQTVPVYMKKNLLSVSETELCQALERAWLTRTRYKTHKIMAKLKTQSFREIKKSLRYRHKNSSLQTTTYFNKLKDRLVKTSGKKSVFHGYSDHLAMPMLRALGLSQSSSTT